jgi:NAD(P)-dependent dehydrogenase (short-subunit alcohol dehydrogenase family)
MNNRFSSDVTRRLFLKSAAGTMLGVPTVSALLSDTAMATNGSGTCPDMSPPMKDVMGKVVFITGGSSGIGLGIARACFEVGMKVVISYRTREHRDEAMKHFESDPERAHAVELDVTNRGAVEAAAAEAAKRYGKVHVLANNAGVYALGPLSEATQKDWDWMMGVNLGGVFNCVSAFLPYLRAHGEGGHIVTTASAWGLYGVDGAAIYCASKAAAIMMMEVLRGELARQKIGVSVYCPGAVFSRAWDADRNRPSDSTGPKTDKDPRKQAEIEATFVKLRATGAVMDPLEAGRMVLQGISSNYMYIFTHPEYEAVIRNRSEALLASIPRNSPVPEARILAAGSTLHNPAYAVERDRRQCLAGASR